MFKGTGNDAQQVENNQQGTPYSVIDDAIADFDFAPIALRNISFYRPETEYGEVMDTRLDNSAILYLTSVDGKYGVLDNKNNWVIEPQYTYVTYYYNLQQFYASNENPEIHATHEVVAQDEYGIYHTQYSGGGGPVSLQILESDSGLKPYLVFGEDKKAYEPENGLMRVNGMDWATYENEWYFIGKEGKLYGSYALDEIPCYEANLFKENEGTISPNLMATFHSMFYAPEDGKYRVYNVNGVRKSDELYDAVKPLTKTWMKLEKDGETKYLDYYFNEYAFSDFDQVAEPMQNKAYAKIDGEWKYIQVENTQKDDPEMMKVYKSEVDKVGKKIETDKYLSVYYSLYDINHDGTKELIIKSGHGESGYIYTIYTYEDKLIKIGETSAAQSGLEVDPDGIGIYRNTAHMGVQYIDRLTIENNEIKEERILEPLEFPQVLDYVSYEPIPYYNYDDYTGFENAN